MFLREDTKTIVGTAGYNQKKDRYFTMLRYLSFRHIRPYPIIAPKISSQFVIITQ